MSSLRGLGYDFLAAAPLNIQNRTTLPGPGLHIPANLPERSTLAIQLNPAPAPRLPIIEPRLPVTNPQNESRPPSLQTQRPIVRRHVIQPPPPRVRDVPQLPIPIVPGPQTITRPPPPPPPPLVIRSTNTKQRRSADEMTIPEPLFFRDTRKGEYGLRCVCGESFINVGMVQCDKCDFWLHNMCVNIARTGRHEQYFCPFCERKKIRCSCGKNMKYDEPLIQCSLCRNWVHKECENLDFGPNPSNFVCKRCHGPSEYPLPHVTFDVTDQSVPDSNVILECDKEEILGMLPEGPLKAMVITDLEQPMIPFRATVEKYFHAFAPLLFDRHHEFWKVFCDVLSRILNCDKSVLLNAIDLLAQKLLYTKTTPFRGVDRVNGLENSEAIEEFLGKMQIPRIDGKPNPVRLVKTPEGRVITPVPIDDGRFICEVPGFLIHTDEVKADNGIPLNCMLITDNELVIDTEGGTFDLASSIRRSFHFNTIVKIVRIDGDLKVGLFAVRTKGPLLDEKARRGTAIPASGEIVLPLDGDIPYPTAKCEWKDRRQRPRSAPVEKKAKAPAATERPKRRQEAERVNIRPGYTHPGLTLLSLFVEAAVPPLPVVLLPDDEAVEQYRVQQEIRTRVRTRGRRSET